MVKSSLRALSCLTYGRPAWGSTAVFLIGTACALAIAVRIRIGNPVEGSNLLWEDSDFNVSVAQINRHFPGVNTLELVLEAKDPKNPSRVARQAETVMTMNALQQTMEQGDSPPRATLSFADYLMEGNRLYAGCNPKWLPMDPTDSATNAAASAVLMGSSPKAYSHIVDFEQQNSTVLLRYRDNRQETVDAALADAAAAVARVGAEHEIFTVRLGTGTIALQQAMNRVVDRYHWTILGCLNLVILLVCSLAYRSLIAGLILLIPLNCWCW